jgi:hypothetical protein
MWWGLAAGLVALGWIGRRRWVAARAWEDLKAAGLQITILSARLERVERVLESGDLNTAQGQAAGQADREHILDRLNAMRTTEQRLAAAYSVKLAPFGARLLSLPAPRM